MNNVTIWDYVDAIIFAIILVASYRSNIKVPATLTAGAFLLFHFVGRYYLGKFGAGLEPVIVASVLGCLIGTAHLAFNYSMFGMIIGICYASIGLLGGLVYFGIIGVTFQQGPGFDFWTITTILTWIAAITLGAAIWKARDGIIVNLNVF